MDMREKHLSDQNRMANLVSIIITTSMLILSLLAFAGRKDLILVGRCLILVIVLIINVACVRIYKTTVIYRHIVSVSTCVAYFAMIFTYGEEYVYAYVFPIAIMVMIFQDGRLILNSAVIAFIANVIFFATFMMRFPGKLDAQNIVVEMLLVLVACITCILIIKMQQAHGQENLDVIETRAAAQAQVAKEVVNHSQELADKFQQAMEVSDTLNECMDSSHNSVSEIAESTKLTADAIEQQTAQTLEIQQHMQQVEMQAREMSELSESTRAAVEEGVRLIDKLKTQALEVAKISHETEQTTKNLNESIKEVEAITETILGISTQTNLLALNASIEAARAGEAGKGFAVVADEIRNLSEGTKQATEQISTIINKLTRDAEVASESMSQSAVYAEKQNEMISVTGDKLTGIQQNSDELYSDVKRVSDAVQEVVVANTAISDSISNLSATSEQVAASTDSSLALSDSSMGALKDMNDLLNEIYTISEEMRKLSGKA